MNDDHIKPSRRHLLALSQSARIGIVQKNVWVDCPQCVLILRMVKNIVHSARQIPAPCLLVCGKGGVGKTAIIRQFKKLSASWDHKILFLDMAQTAKNLQLRDKFLIELGVPSLNDRGRGDLPSEIAEWIKLQRIRAVVVDEFHDALLVSPAEQRRTLSLLKALAGDPYGLTIIGFGTEGAHNALMHDPQLARRYHVHQVPTWSESESFRAFLAAIEENLPLRKPSVLYSQSMVQFLLRDSLGIMDNIIKMIKAGAIYAIASGSEKITIEGIRQGLSNPWAYEVSPESELGLEEPLGEI